MDTEKLAQEDGGSAKQPCKSKGAPSILYCIDNIPNNTVKFEVISHFQKRKRFKGGEVVIEEYQAVGSNSALILFENAEGESLYLLNEKV